MDWSPLVLASLLFSTTWLLETFALKLLLKRKHSFKLKLTLELKLKSKLKLTFKSKLAAMDLSPLVLASLLF